MRFFVEVLLCAAGREGRVGAKGRNRDCECSFFFQVPLCAADRGGRVGAKGRNRDCKCSFFRERRKSWSIR